MQDVGDAKKKRKKVVVGDDEEAEVTDAALMIHVEKCLARLRKSLSPATIANGMVRATIHLSPSPQYLRWCLCIDSNGTMGSTARQSTTWRNS